MKAYPFDPAVLLKTEDAIEAFVEAVRENAEDPKAIEIAEEIAERARRMHGLNGRRIQERG
jgi:DNA-binding phage protein